MNRDNTPTFNVNSKVRNFGDFCNNWEDEKQKLKKVKRSYQENSDRQNFPTNTRNEFDPITRKITAYTEEEVEDKIKAIEDFEGTNESISKLRSYETGGRFSHDLLIVKINDLIDVVNKLEEEVKELKNPHNDQGY